MTAAALFILASVMVFLSGYLAGHLFRSRVVEEFLDPELKGSE